MTKDNETKIHEIKEKIKNDMVKLNKDGTERRRPRDNIVIKIGKPFNCNGKSVEYKENTWYVDGLDVSSLGWSSKAVGLNKTTYKFGEMAESNGFVFAKKF